MTTAINGGKFSDVLEIESFFYNIPFGFMFAAKHFASLHDGHQLRRALSTIQFPLPAMKKKNAFENFQYCKNYG